MMNACGKHIRRRPAFTLVELMLAVLILAVVVGAIQGTMQMGFTAYRKGQQDMELYQSARIGLNRLIDEIRGALSPTAFWRPGAEIKETMTWEQAMELVRFGNAVEEDEPGPIQFIGSSDEVTFARKVYGGTSNRDFDLQEVRFSVDSSKNQLRMEIIQSLLEIKIASWYFAYLFQTKLNAEILIDQAGQAHRIRQISSPNEPAMKQFIGDAGMDGRSLPIAYGIKEVEFRYSDGEQWTEDWDSTEYIRIPLIPMNRDDTYYENPEDDFMHQEKGLPSAMEIKLVLANGAKLEVQIDIPAGSLNHLGIRDRQRDLARGPQAESGTAQPGERRGAQMYRRMLRRRI
ncbi:MAG TPA: prepilin-type N-terminal cleavage/methylation domain-containing protein [bacterium]|nr:prepilin-type N-terminal cleavage/methylation domain-containing protein [bacterium]HPO07184.1 prepilin-type N-terminal cleavage/methylation domain-containing protein [bacterium]HQO34236.1 prepilin-type N-terminal cleavage/methylation domain-containing protein [bacterium]HQP98875.1 prepilin-type N-terminal cleavage/methylation domain-containing protein [bacterium]